jgi:hypothetical protein
MDAASSELLFRTEVKWLSKDRALKCMYELHEELKECFYKRKGFENLFS